ncbi:DUF5071 domain-containing protein [Robertmurraya massiliosenegalensis]|uniref:DUF5071 domain-containing protein n=1 Tax=Robertmurraya massiliosenegalensis TaxID=1287657 RepID=UPI0002FEC304|nr:DUF5071 domain-containing protein [Robertmurraya massiliosenegalensis]
MKGYKNICSNIEKPELKAERIKSYAEYLPRDKFDFDCVKQLKSLNRSEVIPLLPVLMEWIQDMKWPIAEEVSELLLK